MLLAACGDDPTPLPRLAPDAVILAFGDSLTHGTGARDDQSYPAVLARRTGRTIRSGVDCLIAACAIRNGLEVMHVDRDYDALADVSPLQVRSVSYEL